MSAGYTDAELNALHDAMLQNQPADPSSEDLNNASRVAGITFAALYNGLLLKILFQSKETELVKLNCVVALELMTSINNSYGHWNLSGPIGVVDAEVEILPDEQALDVISFATGAASDGLPVNFTNGQRSVTVFLPPQDAMRILVAINSAGEAAGWWNKMFVLQPARVLEEIEIQQEAAQLINRYKEKAAAEACQRAISAFERGDMFTHEIWQRVTMTVREMEQTRPADDNPLSNCVLPHV